MAESVTLGNTERLVNKRMQKAVSARLSTMLPERADAARNRQRILKAVRHLLGETPFDEIKMQDIAKTAGVGQGTLYRRFASKGELSEALFADDMRVFRNEAEAYLEKNRATPALERLEWLIANKVRFIDVHLPLFLASYEGSGRERFECFKKDHHLWMVAWVGGLLREANARGESHIGDVVFATDALLASFSPPLLAYQRRELGFSVERVILGVTELFIGQPAAARANPAAASK